MTSSDPEVQESMLLLRDFPVGSLWQNRQAQGIMAFGLREIQVEIKIKGAHPIDSSESLTAFEPSSSMGTV